MSILMRERDFSQIGQGGAGLRLLDIQRRKYGRQFLSKKVRKRPKTDLPTMLVMFDC